MIKNNIKSLKPELQNEMQESISYEIKERELRKYNVIIFNIPDDNNHKTDRNLLIKLFKDSNITSNDYKFYRTGTFEANKTRAIKVCFKNPEKSSLVLKNSKNLVKLLPEKAVITSDRTKNEIQYYKQIKTMLVEKQTQNPDEEYTIKYFHGVPKIILKKSKN